MRRTITCVAIACALPACTSKPAPERPADRIVVGTTETVATTDPATCYDFFCASMLFANTHDGLVRLRGGKPSPALATSWKISDDGRVYTFALRRGVRFHDGSAFDARAAKASLERVRALASPNTAAFLLFGSERGITSIEAPDAETLVLTLGQRDAAFLARLGSFQVGGVVPPGPYPGDREAERGIIVGTGPYKLAPGGFKEGDQILLERNDSYWGRKAATRRVLVRLFSTPAQLALALRKDEVDVAFRGLGAAEVASFRKTKDFRVIEADGAVIRFLAFNVAQKSYDNVHRRRAVAAAIDRQAIVERVLKKTVVPLYGMVPRGFEAHHQDFKTELSSRQVVEQELSMAAVPAGDKIAVDLWYTPSHYGETEADVARALKESLESTNRMFVNVRASEWTDYKTAFARGDFGVFLLGWFPDYLDPDNYLEPFIGTAGARAIGSNYSSAEVDRLLSEERTATDPGRRTAIFEELQKRIVRDVPYVPLWQSKQIAVARTGVSGLTLDTSQTLRLAGIRKS